MTVVKSESKGIYIFAAILVIFVVILIVAIFSILFYGPKKISDVFDTLNSENDNGNVQNYGYAEEKNNKRYLRKKERRDNRNSRNNVREQKFQSYQGQDIKDDYKNFRITEEKRPYLPASPIIVKDTYQTYGERINIKLNGDNIGDLAKDDRSRKIFEECENSSQCEGTSICAASKILRLSDFNKEIGSNVNGKNTKQFMVNYLEDNNLSPQDFLEFEGSVIILLNNGEIFTANHDKDQGSIIKSNIDIVDLSTEGGSIYALTKDGKVYRLDINSYTTNHWKWIWLNHLPENISSIESPRNGELLFMSDKDNSYIVVNDKIQKQMPFQGFRVYGKTAEKYAVIDENGTIKLNPSGKVIRNVEALAIGDDGKLFMYSQENSKGIIKRMRIIGGEPVFITNQVCMKEGMKMTTL